MSDLNSVTKRLTYSKCREATAAEATNASPKFLKYYGRKKCRTIEKIPSTIRIAAFVIGPPAYSPGMDYGLPFLQYNYSFGESFFVAKVSAPNLSNCFVTIKYRIGTTVYRYLIIGTQYEINAPAVQQHAFPTYNNERIPSNFCLEFWVRTGDGLAIGFNTDIIITTSKLNVPATGDVITYEVPCVAAYLPPSMALAIPFTPAQTVDNSNVAFLTN